MKSLFFFIGLTLAFTLFFGTTAYADVTPDSTGLKATAGAAGLVRSESVSELIGNVIGTLLSMVGVLFFLLMLYGGVLWMTARGNDDQTSKAMHTIIAASIGIVIVLASYALTNFVFTSVNEQKGGGAAGAAGAPAGGAPVGGGNAPQDNDCTTFNPTWSCRDIDTCGLVVPVGANLAQKRQACDDDNDCQTGLCEGGGNIVCCTP